MDRKIRIIKIIISLGVCVLYIKPVLAGEWSIDPSLTLKETYSDNINLAPSNAEEEEYITEINPGISIHGKGRRASLNLNYNMQNLIYARDSDRNKTNHRLAADGNAEILRDHFFIDGAASISQQLIAPGTGFSLGNLNPGNRDDVHTYKLSPYYLHDLKGFVNTEVRYTYDAVRIDQGASDSDAERVNVNLSSGHKFTKLSWDLAYSDETIERDTADNIEHETTLGNLRYLLGRGFSFVATAGNENHDFNSNQPVNNGSYWAAGISWTPGRKFSVEVLEGNNYKTASVTINPTTRTSMNVAWQDREIGTNLGETWSGTFSLRTRRATWQASYLEDTTSFQQLVAIPRVFFDYFTRERVDNPEEGQLVIIWPDNLFAVYRDGLEAEVEAVFGTLIGSFDDIFTRKRGQLSVSFQTGKSTFLISLYNEIRDLESSTDDQITKGGNISWNWKFATRTSLNLSASEQRLDFQDSTREDKANTYEVRVSRNISPKTNSSISYRHTTLDSTNVASEYDENRLVLSLAMKF